MGYFPAMRANFLFVTSGLVFMFVAAPVLRADEVDMQNGDRYSGKVLSVSADTVVLDSEMLGKINVPRKKVANLTFGSNAAAPKTTANAAPASVSTNPPMLKLTAPSLGTNVDLSAAFSNLGTNTNFVGQIRQQMLVGNPDAASNYDAMISGLMSGAMSMDDLRRQAQSAADQLREMKREAGAQADPSFDAYLEVLDNFLKETGGTPTNAISTPPPRTPAP